MAEYAGAVFLIPEKEDSPQPALSPGVYAYTYVESGVLRESWYVEPCGVLEKPSGDEGVDWILGRHRYTDEGKALLVTWVLIRRQP